MKLNEYREMTDNVSKDDPRIIIPLFYQNILVGFQGRALGPNKVKYITIMLETLFSAHQRVNTQLTFTSPE